MIEATVIDSYDKTPEIQILIYQALGVLAKYGVVDRQIELTEARLKFGSIDEPETELVKRIQQYRLDVARLKAFQEMCAKYKELD